MGVPPPLAVSLVGRLRPDGSLMPQPSRLSARPHTRHVRFRTVDGRNNGWRVASIGLFHAPPVWEMTVFCGGFAAQVNSRNQFRNLSQPA